MSDQSEHPETRDYAAALARHLEPVRRIPPLRWVAAALSLLALFVAGLATALLGLRGDAMPDLPFVGVVAGLLVFGVGGLVSALGASIPGREALSRVGLAGVALAAVLWSAALLAAPVGDVGIGPFDSAWVEATFSCLGMATGVGFIPAVALLAFVLGAFPYRPALAGGLGVAAMVAFGSGAVHLTCANNELFHVSIGHVIGPLASGALVGAFLVIARQRRQVIARGQPQGGGPGGVQ